MNPVINYSKIKKLEKELATQKEDFAQHMIDTMPHQFIDLQTNTAYKYGLQISVEGNPQLIFEEVT